MMARSRTAGFSLIEILVVLFIIGLVVGIVSVRINIGDGDSADNLQEQVQDFLQKSRFAEDQAVLTGKPYGLVIEPPNLERQWLFRWQRYQDGQWGEAEEVLTEQTFAEEIDLAAEVEGNAVEFQSLSSLDDEPRLPTVIFYPGGEVTSFTMTLFNRDHIDESAMITSEIAGVVQLMDEDENYDTFFQQQ